MYIDNEIKNLREKLKIIQEEKINAENQEVLQELDIMEKEVSSLLISKFYRMINYSRFDTKSLVDSLADLISVVEDKNMTPDVVFVSEKIGNSHFSVPYSKLIIRATEDVIPTFYDSKEQFEEMINDKDIIILKKSLNGIPNEIDVFELVKNSVFINKDNMNLNNIKGIQWTIDFDKRDYLEDFVATLVNYKWEQDKLNISDAEMADVMNEYAFQLIESGNKKLIKVKNAEESF